MIINKMYTGCNSAPRLEKKYVEKKRRNNMKNLFNHLCSLLPPHPSQLQEAMTLPDQIDASITYIKNLEIKLEKSKMQLEKLRTKKRFNLLCMANHDPNPSISKLSSPQIEVQEMSPTMDLILISGLDNLVMFYNIIRLFHEENFEVINSNFSLDGNSMMQIFHETKVIGDSTMVYRRVKELLNGSSSNDDIIEALLHSWDNEIQSEMLGLINLM
ncbi:hypothetical protein EJD97_019091 [Solanum chilense]|uniref:BHLH domain-containing protein n=1 Tax=Solanum chilense TaxID=4083 RepID=A0A6N2B445_SOLCI|nr:hypothetical protein EJD97_019091 [Solanum chilense]